MYYHDGVMYFTTTADDRVWAYRCRDAAIEVFYDAQARIDAGLDAPLRDPDNLVVDASGFVYVTRGCSGQSRAGVTDLSARRSQGRRRRQTGRLSRRRTEEMWADRPAPTV
jgi:sugar lactone lactonase YvrE